MDTTALWGTLVDLLALIVIIAVIAGLVYGYQWFFYPGLPRKKKPRKIYVQDPRQGPPPPGKQPISMQERTLKLLADRPPGSTLMLLEGDYGPEFLTGEIKEASQAALEMIKTYAPPKSRNDLAMTMLEAGHSGEWATLDGAAADFLGALRWRQKVLKPQLDDYWLRDQLIAGPVQIIEFHIRGYQNGLPPGPDRDQALRILEWFHYQLHAKHPTLASHAVSLATTALTRKVRKTTAGNPDQP